MILDTNALSALADGNPAIEPLIRTATEVAVPVIALGEYRFGVAQSKKKVFYDEWLEEYLRSFRVLKIDETTAQAYAVVRLELKTAGKPIPVNDLWIAALAWQHRLPVLSRDRHFDAVSGVRRIGW